MKVIMNLAQKVFCLAHGQMLANGTPEEIKNDKRVYRRLLRSTIMSNQYDVLGKAPGIRRTKKTISR